MGWQKTRQRAWVKGRICRKAFAGAAKRLELEDRSLEFTNLVLFFQLNFTKYNALGDEAEGATPSAKKDKLRWHGMGRV